MCYQEGMGVGRRKFSLLHVQDIHDLQVLNHSILLLTSNTAPSVRSLFWQVVKCFKIVISCDFNCHPLPKRSWPQPNLREYMTGPEKCWILELSVGGRAGSQDTVLLACFPDERIFFWRQNVCVRIEGKGGNLGMELYLPALTMN